MQTRSKAALGHLLLTGLVLIIHTSSSFHSRSIAYLDPIITWSKRLQYVHVLIIVVCMTSCYNKSQTTTSDANLGSFSTPMCPLMPEDQSSVGNHTGESSESNPLYLPQMSAMSRRRPRIDIRPRACWTIIAGEERMTRPDCFTPLFVHRTIGSVTTDCT